MDDNGQSIESKSKHKMASFYQNQETTMIRESRGPVPEIEIIGESRSPNVELIWDSRESQIEMIWDSRDTHINRPNEPSSGSGLRGRRPHLEENIKSSSQEKLKKNVDLILHVYKCRQQKEDNMVKKKNNGEMIVTAGKIDPEASVSQKTQQRTIQQSTAVPRVPLGDLSNIARKQTNSYQQSEQKNKEFQNCSSHDSPQLTKRVCLGGHGSPQLKNEREGREKEKGKERDGKEKEKEKKEKKEKRKKKRKKEEKKKDKEKEKKRSNLALRDSELRVLDDDGYSNNSDAPICVEVKRKKFIISPYVNVGMIGGIKELVTSHLCDNHKIPVMQYSEVKRYHHQGLTVSPRNKSQIRDWQQSHPISSSGELSRNSNQHSPVGANLMIDDTVRANSIIDDNQEFEISDGVRSLEVSILIDSYKIPDKGDSEIEENLPEGHTMSPRESSQVIDGQLLSPNQSSAGTSKIIQTYPAGSNLMNDDTRDLENSFLLESQKTPTPPETGFKDTSFRIPNSTPGEQSQIRTTDSHSWLKSSSYRSNFDEYHDEILSAFVSQQSQTLDVIHDCQDYPYPIPMMYDNAGGVRGVVHIFNYYEFTNEEKNFLGGEMDGRRILTRFDDLEYKVKIHINLSKDETDNAFQDIQQTEGLADENVIIFFILSHGVDENTFLSSDCEVIDLKEKMLLFRKDNCSAMKHKPQVWFGDFCRGVGHQRGVGPFSKKDGDSGHDEYYGRTEVFSNMLYVMSSNPGISSVFEDGGSSFSTVICNMIQEGKYELDNMWFMELNTLLREKKCPNTVRLTYDPFPGQLFYPQGFSLCYDVDEVNKKKII